MEIELPDGTVLEAPDGADTRKVVAGYKASLSAPKGKTGTGKSGLTESPTSLNNLIGAAIEPTLSMGTGAGASILSGLAGLGTSAGNAVGLTNTPAADVVRKVGSALTYQPKTVGGQNAMKAFGAIPDALSQVVPALVEQGYRDPEMASFGDQTVGAVNPAIATALDTLVQGGPQILGAKGLARAPRIIPPKAVNPEVAALAKEGVTMTPGQRRGGSANIAEQKLSSVPYAGDFVARARGKAIEQWNTARLNEALKDAGGKPVPKNRTGRDALFHVEQEMKRRYGEVLDKMSVDVDQQFQSGLNAAKQLKGLDKKSAKTVAQIIDDEVTSKLKGKADLKEVQETLRTEADGHRRGNYQERKIASALDKARDALSAALKRQNPKLAPELEGIDKGYAKFHTAARASRYGKKTEGVYSPAQRLRAIESRDKSKSKTRFATGKAHGQKEAEGAERILGNTVPDSGTPGRYALMQGLLSLLGGGGAVAGHAPALGALGLAPLLYSQPVLKALQRAALSGESPAGIAGSAAVPVGASEEEAMKRLGAVP